MAKDNISPEERLFKVIQEEQVSSGDDSVKKKGLQAGLQKITSLKRFSFKGLKRFFERLAAKPESELGGGALSFVFAPRFHKKVDYKLVNKILTVLLIGLTVLVVHCVLNKRPKVSQITGAIAKIKFQAIKKGAIEKFKPVEIYLEQVKKRDIFKPSPRPKRKIAVISGAKEARAKLKEIVKDLKIVGISWGKTPKAMVRSKKEQSTYFLREGQMIGATGIEVKTILKDKVIITYQGEEMELL